MYVFPIETIIRNASKGGKPNRNPRGRAGRAQHNFILAWLEAY
jgi:hypothetical protein